MRASYQSAGAVTERQQPFSTGSRLRACEWALIAFFCYVAGISTGFHLRSDQPAVPFIVAGVAAGLLFGFAYAEEHIARRFCTYARDWVTLVLVLAAYREMNWFTPKVFDYHLEKMWIVWDRAFLHWLALIKFAGPLIPALLELSYLLVYAVGPFTVVAIYLLHRRQVIGWVLFVYVVGTVAAYGLFPYFPSAPPRVVFPGADLPDVVTPLRWLNLQLVGGYGIHSSVFPSAHVSSAFSAAWGMLIFLPDKRRLGWGMAAYAVLVSIATVYGRYHYAVDALAGLGISLGAAGLTLLGIRLGWTGGLQR